MKISILTAAKNSSKTLKECINSVKTQTIRAEHIIIDGASSDNTLAILDQFKHQSLRFFSEPDHGMYDAMNKGIALSTGDVVGILNADDIYTNRHILSKISKVFKNSAIDACFGDLMYVDSNRPDRIIRYWRAGPFNFIQFYNGWMPPHPTFFVRHRIYEQHGGFNLALGTAADYELMLRFLLKHRITVAYIPEVLVNMRTGGVSNASLRNRIRANKMDRMAWEVNGLKPYPWTLWMKPLRKIPQYFLRH